MEPQEGAGAEATGQGAVMTAQVLEELAKVGREQHKSQPICETNPLPRPLRRLQ
jgi:hypothetical protein